MNELIMTVGLPRSGKTTHAKGLGHPIVNPDSIRLALHGKPFIGLAEPFVWAIAKTMVRALFLAGHDTVILDATNTTIARRDQWKSKTWNRKFVGFGGADMRDTCVARAAEQYPDDEESRTGLIGAIERMAENFEETTAGELTPEEGGPE